MVGDGVSPSEAIVDYESLGIDPTAGGCVCVVVGKIGKNEPWRIKDKDTKEVSSGHSLHVVYFGGVLKVKTDERDPLRLIPTGTPVKLAVPMLDNGSGLRQFGAAKEIPEPKKGGAS